MHYKQPNKYEAGRFLKWLLGSIEEVTAGGLRWAAVGLAAFAPLLLPIGVAPMLGKQGGALIYAGHFACALGFGMYPAAQAFFTINVRRLTLYEIPLWRSFELSFDDMLKNAKAIAGAMAAWTVFGACAFPVMGAAMSISGFDWASGDWGEVSGKSAAALAALAAFFCLLLAPLAQTAVLCVGAQDAAEPVARSIRAFMRSKAAMSALSALVLSWYGLCMAYPLAGAALAPVAMFAVDLCVRDCWLDM